MKRKIMLGLSGGVDSAVAALLLKQQGETVEAVFMKNWEADDDDAFCTAEQDLADAKAVADNIGIPLHTVNFSKTYWDKVFEHFLNEYQAGRTPNPDILCNTEIKFKAFLAYALEAGATCIATGHYARVQQQENSWQLLKGTDPQKDQSYFLHGLNQHQLSHSLFPLGELNKSDIRAIAKTAGFSNHNKKDSTGICFIGERRFKTFLSEYLPAQPGDIKTLAGETLGRHDGLMYYTIGQRKGIQIGGLKSKPEAPWYVVDKDIAKNVLLVSQSDTDLLKSELNAQLAHWIAGTPPNFPLRCTAKIRYRQSDQPCTVQQTKNQLHVVFDTPQRAITPGQSIVFYQEAVCLGGAIIL